MLPLAAAAKRLSKRRVSDGLSTYQRHRAAKRCGRCGTPSRKPYCAACLRRTASRVRLKHTGISEPQYAAALLKQGARCAICQIHQAKLTKALHADHDHASGVFRGLLCQRCNTGLGMFLDQPRRLLDAVEYLLRCLATAPLASKREASESSPGTES